MKKEVFEIRKLPSVEEIEIISKPKNPEIQSRSSAISREHAHQVALLNKRIVFLENAAETLKQENARQYELLQKMMKLNQKLETENEELKSLSAALEARGKETEEALKHKYHELREKSRRKTDELAREYMEKELRFNSETESLRSQLAKCLDSLQEERELRRKREVQIKNKVNEIFS